MKSVLVGWICRIWIETTEGWKSETYKYKTEEEANICRRKSIKDLGNNELSRQAEVFKDYTVVW